LGEGVGVYGDGGGKGGGGKPVPRIFLKGGIKMERRTLIFDLFLGSRRGLETLTWSNKADTKKKGAAMLGKERTSQRERESDQGGFSKERGRPDGCQEGGDRRSFLYESKGQGKWVSLLKRGDGA